MLLLNSISKATIPFKKKITEQINDTQMTRFLHILSIIVYVLIITVTIIGLYYYGGNYYKLPIENRYYTATGEVNTLHEQLKPSGIIGHGLGIIGSTLIVVGLFGYMARKRMKIFAQFGVLKYWLEFHIFLCTLGAIMVLFHTSFKFGGIVSIGFWSMVIVWVSGVIGRFIYLQIPRSIEGRELSLGEINDQEDELELEISTRYKINFAEIKQLKFAQIKKILKSRNIIGHEYVKLKRLVKSKKKIERRIKHLDKMQLFFRYWHVAHLPFALIMLVIMIIHIGVSIFWGYKWIF